MFCHDCGKELENDATVCINCGANVIHQDSKKTTDYKDNGKSFDVEHLFFQPYDYLNLPD